MVFEGVEFVQLDIDDLLLAPAWSILRLIGFLWSGSGLYRWSCFFLRFLFDRISRFLCRSFGLRSGGLVLICFRGTAPENLDLKKAARAVGEKSIELLHVAEINAVTGYIRGGCSPVGMKKQYPTVFHETALDYDTIYISGGRIGAQVELAPRALLDLLGASTADIVVDQG